MRLRLWFRLLKAIWRARSCGPVAVVNEVMQCQIDGLATAEESAEMLVEVQKWPSFTVEERTMVVKVIDDLYYLQELIDGLGSS